MHGNTGHRETRRTTKKVFTALPLAIALLVSPLVVTHAKDKPPERVSFESGASSTTVTGRLGSEQGVRYLLGARNGQFLTVSLRPDNQFTHYTIYVPGGDILYESSQAGGRDYKGQLYKNGDHVVEVFYKGEPGTFSSYDIVFEITGAQPAAKSRATTGTAESACLAAVAKETGRSGLSVIRVEKAESGTLVSVQVPGAEAPWNCFHDGARVGNVYYGGEG